MKMKFLILIIASILSVHAFANEGNERMYLTQMLNQLDALNHLIIAASKEQPPNTRRKFHYIDGLLKDVNEIKRGIDEKLNQTGLEPHRFKAIKGDYMHAN